MSRIIVGGGMNCVSGLFLVEVERNNAFVVTICVVLCIVLCIVFCIVLCQ